ncbi:hypothetical protein HK100_001834 [Physocladia obscura]|uniref:G-protein coupled receptors family 1 profile domain-containing protein n=1 Tax=Physocladia obscura TaxID=109957 RepID=A0AAD5SYC0_9FUNG|nr:hypothetical protein HK100_001834 [Physocladia obscura]
MCVTNPISLVGAILNAMVLAAMLSDPTKLLCLRMDKIILLLNMTSLLFALFLVFVENLGQMWYNSAWFSSFQGAGQCFLVILLFALNMLLAIERYMFMRFPRRMRNDYLFVCLGFIVICGGIVLWLFTTSPTFDGVNPINELQYTIWLFGFAGALIISITISVTMYTLSYLHIVKLIAVSTNASQAVKTKAQQLQKRSLISCMVMSSSLLICYAPEAIFQVIAANVNLSETGTLVANVITDIFLASDSAVTALLILYFRAHVRSRFWKMFGFGIVGQNWILNDDDEFMELVGVSGSSGNS